jgi:hypothetical protein
MEAITRIYIPFFKGLLNGHIGYPQFKFQISNHHLPYQNLGFFFRINTYICALNQGAHTSLSKIIFCKQIRMSLVLVHNWHETAVFTKYKHIILIWINSLKYDAWQLSFQNVQNVSVKSKLHLEIYYPQSSRSNKHWHVFIVIQAVKHKIMEIVVLQFQCLCRLLTSMGY